MIRVAIVDDQELVRSGIAMVVQSQPDLEVAWQAAHGALAIEAQRADPADLIIMDVRMPVMDGIDATARLADSARILVLTTFDLDEYALAALRAGAGGFLLKDAPGEELLAAIRHINAGDQVLAPATTKRLLDRYVVPKARDTSRRHGELRDLLTPRELQVAREVTSGATNAQIAGRLYLSETTVKTHIRAILRKIDGRDRVHIVIAVYEAGIVE